MWHVYILECVDGSYYTGITNNIERRVAQHNSGSGSKYVRAKRPAKLIASINVESRQEASRIERIIKKKNKNEKIAALLEIGTENKNK